MANIFVDANVLLGFWSLKDNRLDSKLLLPLVELKDQILLTKQVADEISRNKLRIFLESSVSSKIHSLPNIPDHMANKEKLGKWNNRVEKSFSEISDLCKEWERDIRPAIAQDISNNVDLPSYMLSNLINRAKSPSPQQINAARIRREMGNPPGKRGDPLGDQVSWEQILDEAKLSAVFWIITRDGDYIEEIKGKLMLNPFLRAELKNRGVKKIEIHNNLAHAIKAIRHSGLKIAESLTDRQLIDIEKAEDKALRNIPSHSYFPSPPSHCPGCGEQGSFGALIPAPSRYGGWTYQSRCGRCGSMFDGGEPYED